MDSDEFECTQVLHDSVSEETSVLGSEKLQVACLDINEKQFPIFNGDTKIGRDPKQCLVVLDKKSVSSHHALIEVESGHHLICDLGSSNSTRLNGMLLKPHVRYNLTDGSQVQIADLRGTYTIGSAKMSELETSVQDIFATPARCNVKVTRPTPKRDSLNFSGDDSIIGSTPMRMEFKQPYPIKNHDLSKGNTSIHQESTICEQKEENAESEKDIYEEETQIESSIAENTGENDSSLFDSLSDSTSFSKKIISSFVVPCSQQQCSDSSLELHLDTNESLDSSAIENNSLNPTANVKETVSTTEKVVDISMATDVIYEAETQAVSVADNSIDSGGAEDDLYGGALEQELNFIEKKIIEEELDMIERSMSSDALESELKDSASTPSTSKTSRVHNRKTADEEDLPPKYSSSDKGQCSSVNISVENPIKSPLKSTLSNTKCFKGSANSAAAKDGVKEYAIIYNEKTQNVTLLNDSDSDTDDECIYGACTELPIGATLEDTGNNGNAQIENMKASDSETDDNVTNGPEGRKPNSKIERDADIHEAKTQAVHADDSDSETDDEVVYAACTEVSTTNEAQNFEDIEDAKTQIVSLGGSDVGTDGDGVEDIHNVKTQAPNMQASDSDSETDDEAMYGACTEVPKDPKTNHVEDIHNVETQALRVQASDSKTDEVGVSNASPEPQTTKEEDIHDAKTQIVCENVSNPESNGSADVSDKKSKKAKTQKEDIHNANTQIMNTSVLNCNTSAESTEQSASVNMETNISEDIHDAKTQIVHTNQSDSETDEECVYGAGTETSGVGDIHNAETQISSVGSLASRSDRMSTDNSKKRIFKNESVEDKEDIHDAKTQIINSHLSGSETDDENVCGAGAQDIHNAKTQLVSSPASGFKQNAGKRKVRNLKSKKKEEQPEDIHNAKTQIVESNASGSETDDEAMYGACTELPRSDDADPEDIHNAKTQIVESNASDSETDDEVMYGAGTELQRINDAGSEDIHNAQTQLVSSPASGSKQNVGNRKVRNNLKSKKKEEEPEDIHNAKTQIVELNASDSETDDEAMYGACTELPRSDNAHPEDIHNAKTQIIESNASDSETDNEELYGAGTELPRINDAGSEDIHNAQTQLVHLPASASIEEVAKGQVKVSFKNNKKKEHLEDIHDAKTQMVETHASDSETGDEAIYEAFIGSEDIHDAKTQLLSLPASASKQKAVKKKAKKSLKNMKKEEQPEDIHNAKTQMVKSNTSDSETDDEPMYGACTELPKSDADILDAQTQLVHLPASVSTEKTAKEEVKVSMKNSKKEEQLEEIHDAETQIVERNSSDSETDEESVYEACTELPRNTDADSDNIHDASTQLVSSTSSKAGKEKVKESLKIKKKNEQQESIHDAKTQILDANASESVTDDKTDKEGDYTACTDAPSCVEPVETKSTHDDMTLIAQTCDSGSDMGIKRKAVDIHDAKNLVKDAGIEDSVKSSNSDIHSAEARIVDPSEPLISNKRCEQFAPKPLFRPLDESERHNSSSSTTNVPEPLKNEDFLFESEDVRPVPDTHDAHNSPTDCCLSKGKASSVSPRKRLSLSTHKKKDDKNTVSPLKPSAKSSVKNDAFSEPTQILPNPCRAVEEKENAAGDDIFTAATQILLSPSQNKDAKKKQQTSAVPQKQRRNSVGDGDIFSAATQILPSPCKTKEVNANASDEDIFTAATQILPSPSTCRTSKDKQYDEDIFTAATQPLPSASTSKIPSDQHKPEDGDIFTAATQILPDSKPTLSSGENIKLVGSIFSAATQVSSRSRSSNRGKNPSQENDTISANTELLPSPSPSKKLQGMQAKKDNILSVSTQKLPSLTSKEKRELVAPGKTTLTTSHSSVIFSSNAQLYSKQRKASDESLSDESTPSVSSQIHINKSTRKRRSSQPQSSNRKRRLGSSPLEVDIEESSSDSNKSIDHMIDEGSPEPAKPVNDNTSDVPENIIFSASNFSPSDSTKELISKDNKESTARTQESNVSPIMSRSTGKRTLSLSRSRRSKILPSDPNVSTQEHLEVHTSTTNMESHSSQGDPKVLSVTGVCPLMPIKQEMKGETHGATKTNATDLVKERGVIETDTDINTITVTDSTSKETVELQDVTKSILKHEIESTSTKKRVSFCPSSEALALDVKEEASKETKTTRTSSCVKKQSTIRSRRKSHSSSKADNETKCLEIPESSEDACKSGRKQAAESEKNQLELENEGRKTRAGRSSQQLTLYPGNQSVTSVRLTKEVESDSKTHNVQAEDPAQNTLTKCLKESDKSNVHELKLRSNRRAANTRGEANPSQASCSAGSQSSSASEVSEVPTKRSTRARKQPAKFRGQSPAELIDLEEESKVMETSGPKISKDCDFAEPIESQGRAANTRGETNPSQASCSAGSQSSSTPEVSEVPTKRSTRARKQPAKFRGPSPAELIDQEEEPEVMETSGPKACGFDKPIESQVSHSNLRSKARGKETSSEVMVRAKRSGQASRSNTLEKEQKETSQEEELCVPLNNSVEEIVPDELPAKATRKSRSMGVCQTSSQVSSSSQDSCASEVTSRRLTRGRKKAISESSEDSSVTKFESKRAALVNPKEIAELGGKHLLSESENTGPENSKSASQSSTECSNKTRKPGRFKNQSNTPEEEIAAATSHQEGDSSNKQHNSQSSGASEEVGRRSSRARRQTVALKDCKSLHGAEDTNVKVEEGVKGRRSTRANSQTNQILPREKGVKRLSSISSETEPDQLETPKKLARQKTIDLSSTLENSVQDISVLEVSAGPGPSSLKRTGTFNESFTSDSGHESKRRRGRVDSVASTSTSPRRSPRQSFRGTSTSGSTNILFSFYNNPRHESIVKQLGGAVVENVEAADVLVTDKLRRTVKLLCIVGKGLPVVSPHWLVQSKNAGRLLDPWEHVLSDKESEQKFVMNLEDSLRKAASKPVLQDYHIFVTKNVKPIPEEMKAIILSCGGHVLPRAPAVWPPSSVIISCQEDKSTWSKMKGNVPIVSAEWLLAGVLRQELHTDDHLLKRN